MAGSGDIKPLLWAVLGFNICLLLYSVSQLSAVGPRRGTSPLDRAINNDIADLAARKANMLADLQNMNTELQKTLGALRQLQMTAADVEQSSAGVPKLPWLLIGIPTIPRQEDYLTPTLEGLVSQMETDPRDPMYGEIELLVMNHKPGNHRVFEELKARYADHPLSKFIDFRDNPLPREPEDTFDAGSPNRPGWKVKQQTKDVAAILGAAAGRSHYYMFMEDDFRLCPHGFEAVRYAIVKSKIYVGEFTGLRMSFGLNGVVIQGGDVGELQSYMLQHLARRPPDHLMTEWMAKETDQAKKYLGDNRRNTAFKYNIFDHLGLMSTLRTQRSPTYPRCYEVLGEPVTFAVEAFSQKDCPEDDVWPCPPQPEGPLKNWDHLHKE